MKTLSDPRKRRKTSRVRRREREQTLHLRKARKAARRRRREQQLQAYEQQRARLLREREVLRVKMPAVPRHLRRIIREQQVEARKGWLGLIGKVVQMFKKKARL